MLAPGPRQAGRPFDLLNPTLAGWLSSGSNSVSLTPDGDQPFSPNIIILFVCIFEQRLRWGTMFCRTQGNLSLFPTFIGKKVEVSLRLCDISERKMVSFSYGEVEHLIRLSEPSLFYSPLNINHKRPTQGTNHIHVLPLSCYFF